MLPSASVGRRRILAPQASRRFGAIRTLACLTVLIVQSISVAGVGVISFGPLTYAGTGRPVLKTSTFSVRTGGNGYALHVDNKGVGAALAILNGRIVLRPSDSIDPPQLTGRADDSWPPLWDQMQRDWNSGRNDRTVATIDKPVTLLSGHNEIVVAFISRTGTSFTLEITSSGPPVPTITASPSPVPNSFGWNNVNVTVSFACTNATTCPGPVTVTTEGAGQVISGTATGPGGTATASVTLNIDKTPPVVMPTPASKANGGDSGPVTVSFTCSDGLSGVATCPADQIVTTNAANQSVTGTATDRAGNAASVTSAPFNIKQGKSAIMMGFDAAIHWVAAVSPVVFGILVIIVTAGKLLTSMVATGYHITIELPQGETIKASQFENSTLTRIIENISNTTDSSTSTRAKTEDGQ